MNYTNFTSIIEDLKKIEFYHKQTNSFGVGDIKQLTYLIQQRDKVENTQDRPPIYPLMYVIPRQVSNFENYVQYSLNVLICDIMNANNYDIEVDLWSSTLAIAQDILAQYKYSVNAAQGDYENKYDLILPATITPFSEAYDDYLVGWNLDLNIIVDMPLNRCLAPFNNWVSPTACPESPTPTPTITATPTITPTNTSTPTPTPTCPITTQYLEVELSENTKFKLILWNEPDFGTPATALCDYTISGVAFGDMGTTYFGTEQILQGQHQKQFNLAPVLQEGEIVSAFMVLSATFDGCICPVDLVLPPNCALCNTNFDEVQLCFTNGTGDFEVMNGNFTLPYSFFGPCGYLYTGETYDIDVIQTQSTPPTFSIFVSAPVLLTYEVEITDQNCEAPQYNILPLSGYTGTGTPPLLNWQQNCPSLQPLWVAGSSGSLANTLGYSVDGVNWSGSTNGNTVFSAISDVAFNGSLWIAAGAGTNTLGYSTDGITWSGSTNGNSVIPFYAQSVAWNGSLWVAGGTDAGNTLGYSTDGITWSASTNGNSILSSVCRVLAFNGSSFVAGGSGTNTLGYSTDGITWSASTNGNSIFSEVYGLAWRNFIWVAGGGGTNRLGYSTDGITWSASTNGNSIFTSAVSSVATNGPLFVAAGSGTNTLAYSTDGITWSASTNGNSIFSSVLGCFAVAWNGTLWVAGGRGTNTLAYSTDGITWSGSTNGNTIFASLGGEQIVNCIASKPAPNLYPPIS